jgi:ribosomal protein S18 acetylase RimI-like enzyme
MNIYIRPVRSADIDGIRALLRRVSVFEPHEIRVAEEVLEAALSGSPDYVVHVAEEESENSDSGGDHGILGYACHGHNPVTDALYDLYWIAVDPVVRGRGVGRALIGHTERCVREVHGRGIVIETSSRVEYEPARLLYERCGYRRMAEVPDFYKPGDALVMYVKFL